MAGKALTWDCIARSKSPMGQRVQDDPGHLGRECVPFQTDPLARRHSGRQAFEFRHYRPVNRLWRTRTSRNPTMPTLTRFQARPLTNAMRYEPVQ